MDCSPPGSSVHGILQARIRRWVAIFSSRGSSRPRDQACLLHFLHWQADSLPLYHLGNLSTSSTNSKNLHTYAYYIAKKKHEILVLPIDAGNFRLHSLRGRIPFARGLSSPFTLDGSAPSLPSWLRTQGPCDGLSEPHIAHAGSSAHTKETRNRAAQAPREEEGPGL